MRPELPAPARVDDDDQTGWLVTFSDLVLQLFAFVIVATVVGRAPTPATAAVAVLPATAVRTAARQPSEPARRPSVVEPPLVAETVPDAAAPEGDDPAEDDDDGATVVGTTAPLPAPPVREPSALERARADLAAFLQASSEGRAVDLGVQDATLVVTLGERISFASSRAQLLGTADPFLGEITRLATRLPGYAIEIAGHTDDEPIHGGPYASNLELSLARAAAVARALTNHDPTLARRVVATGYGDTRPLVTNADATNRARNRRVELRFRPIDAARG